MKNLGFVQKSFLNGTTTKQTNNLLIFLFFFTLFNREHLLAERSNNTSIIAGNPTGNFTAGEFCEPVVKFNVNLTNLASFFPLKKRVFSNSTDMTAGIVAIIDQKDFLLKKEKIIELIKKIPENELENIKQLFKNLFQYKELGFTLYGDKPVAFTTSTHLSPAIYSTCNNIYWYTERILKGDKIYQKEWASWQKYSNLFKINKYIFINDDLGLVLVNKLKLKNVISNNINFFKKILGKDFNSKNLIQNIENGKGIFNLLARNHELFGIVLGFGKHNSRLFQRREEILEVLEPYKIPGNLQNKISPSPKFSSIQEELDDLWKRLDGSNECMYFPITDFNRIIFAADPNHIETKHLKKKYEIQRKKIKRIFSKDDWFEQTLLQLTSED